MPCKQVKTYRLWTEQVNQMVWTVKARNLEEAQRKVERMWRESEPRFSTYLEVTPIASKEAQDAR